MYITEWANLLSATKGRSPQGPNCPVTLRPDIQSKRLAVCWGTHTQPHRKGEGIRAETFLHLLPPTRTHPLCCIKADASPSSREPSLAFALGCHLASTHMACFRGHTFCLLPPDRDWGWGWLTHSVLPPGKSVSAQAHPGLQSTSVGKHSGG